MKGNGIKAAGLRIDWTELMRFKRSFVESVSASKERNFAQAGISAFHGRARFVGPTTVQVDVVSMRRIHVLGEERRSNRGSPSSTAVHVSCATSSATASSRTKMRAILTSAVQAIDERGVRQNVPREQTRDERRIVAS
jgi:hypothetical protein